MQAFKKFSSKTTAQKGLTLIEVMVSLSIFALVVGGALSLFTSASNSQSVNQMRSDLTAIRSSVKSLYSGQGTYGTGGNLNAVLIKSGKVPTTMTTDVSTGKIRHNLNGEINVFGSGDYFEIVVSNIKQDVCAGLVSGITGYTALWTDPGASTAKFPISPETATSTLCTADTTWSGIEVKLRSF